MKFLSLVIACGVVGLAAQMPTAKTQNPPKVSDAIHQLFVEDGEDARNGISKFSEEELTARGKARQTKVRALLAAGEAHSVAVRAGVEYLLLTQQTDGTWHEDHFTGTGFPKVFYLKYHMYSIYFPLMALARYATAVGLPLHATRQRVEHELDRNLVGANDGLANTEYRILSTEY